MKLNNLFNQFQQSSTLTKWVIAALVGIWTMVLVGLIGSAILLLETPGQASPATPGGSPTITLDPATGSAGSSVTVHGQDWNPGGMVLIYLSATETPSYALASAVVDGEGRFSTNLVVPLDSQWTQSGAATIIARTDDNGMSAQATLNIDSPGEQPTVTPTTTETPVPTPAGTLSPTATPQPGLPLATTTTDLNVRSGPSTAYPVLGLLKAGQTAEITGRSTDGGWWQIKFPGVAGERGWLTAQYVTAQHVANVPIVPAPAPPPTATPVPPSPTPVVITDWRGEYYNNPNLSGAPVLLRNDVVISFNWVSGSPAAGLPADGFSARWTRSLGFPAGLYRFALTADDGVRAWVDGNLIIDQWHDSSPKTHRADVRLAEGFHNFRIEYYERSGGAQIDLRWQRLPDQINQPPQPVTGGPYALDEGSRVALDGSRSRDPDGWIAKYEWDYNYDGQTFQTDSTDKNPLASYGDGPVTLTIALRVTDDKGASQIATTKVTVRNVAPNVEAGGPYPGQAGSPVSLVGTATDPSSIDQSGLSYRWDFGDGATGNGPAVSHSYAQAGSYTARLTVADKDGAQAADSATVQINATNQAPMAVITAPANGKVGESLAFSGSNSRDNDGSIAGYAWNFGDGATANSVNANHSYGQAGAYEVALTVTDNGGLTGSSTFTVQINEEPKTPPVAVIEAPASGQVGAVLNFSGSNSSDSDGSIAGYTWDFGDSATGSGVNVTHSYGISGTYQITLTVVDNDGLTAQASQAVTIDEVIQLELPPNVVLEAPAEGRVGKNLRFDSRASNDPDGKIVSYSWDFGDGTVENSARPTIRHNYALPGLYTVTLTITDNDGLINTTTQQVTIK
jgi:PKD repeat protein